MYKVTGLLVKRGTELPSATKVRFRADFLIFFQTFLYFCFHCSISEIIIFCFGSILKLYLSIYIVEMHFFLLK